MFKRFFDSNLLKPLAQPGCVGFNLFLATILFLFSCLIMKDRNCMLRVISYDNFVAINKQKHA